MGRIKKAWWAASEGTSRTVRWAAGGVRDSFSGAAAKARGAVSRSDDAKAPSSPEPAPAGALSSASALATEPARDHRKATVIAGAAVLAAIWLGWTAYVWSENGANAGIGVLISWPAVLAAVALVVAPFVIVARLLRARDDEEGTEAAADAAEAPEADADTGADADEEDDDGDDTAAEEPEPEEDEDDGDADEDAAGDEPDDDGEEEAA